MKPSKNVLYSCSLPPAASALRLSRFAVTQRYMTIASELRTVRAGQMLSDAAAKDLRRLCRLGGTIFIIRKRRLFKDDTGFYDSLELRIEAAARLCPAPEHRSERDQ